MAEVRQDIKPAALRVPAPQFGATCARLGVDDPDPEKTRRVTLAAEQAQDPQRPGDVIVTTNQSHARAVCGRPIPAEGLTIASGPSGALCMACVLGATSLMPARGPRGGNP